jgi:biopolymer transport protein ExbB/biopolymer transport protein TolQ
MDMSMMGLWNSMGPMAKGVFILLCLLSVYSLAVSVERWMTFQKAKQQSVKYALEVTQLLKQDKLKEAIDLAKKYKHSHVAKVLSAGADGP